MHSNPAIQFDARATHCNDSQGVAEFDDIRFRNYRRDQKSETISLLQMLSSSSGTPCTRMVTNIAVFKHAIRHDARRKVYIHISAAHINSTYGLRLGVIYYA